jgi:DNA-binding NarL/FixJ family response regulator
VQDGNGEGKIRVLIADDHHMYIVGLRTVLELEPDIEIVGEAASGIEAVEAAEQLQPHVVLMDVDMPHMDGIEATRELVARHPHIGVVLLSGEYSYEYHSRALRNGARGFLPKDSGRAEITHMVRRASGTMN